MWTGMMELFIYGVTLFLVFGFEMMVSVVDWQVENTGSSVEWNFGELFEKVRKKEKQKKMGKKKMKGEKVEIKKERTWSDIEKEWRLKYRKLKQERKKEESESERESFAIFW